MDAQTRNILQHSLVEVLKNSHRTIVFVTHSVDEAIYLSDRIMVLSSGAVTGIVDGRTAKKEEIGLLMTHSVHESEHEEKETEKEAPSND